MEAAFDAADQLKAIQELITVAHDYQAKLGWYDRGRGERFLVGDLRVEGWCSHEGKMFFLARLGDFESTAQDTPRQAIDALTKALTKALNS